MQVHVINVKTVHFVYNPIQKENEIYDYHFSFQESFKIEENLFRVLVTAVILTEDENDLEKGNATIKVINDYHIANIDRFVVDDKLNLPVDIDKVFMSISYSHARALFADLLSGTSLAKYLLPIVPTDQLYEAKKRKKKV